MAGCLRQQEFKAIAQRGFGLGLFAHASLAIHLLTDGGCAAGSPMASALYL